MPATGLFHTVLLKSDGWAEAFGDNGYGQCNIPALPEGVTYTEAATGYAHTVLLKSDGTAAAFGDNVDGQCNIPALSEGVTYTQAAAGGFHTVLLRAMARLQLLVIISLASATSLPCQKGSPIHKLQQDTSTQFC